MIAPARGEPGSLGRRLSRSLAWQALAVLALVSALVFAFARSEVQARQRGVLAQQEAVVRHLVAEVAASGDRDALRHKLDDFFIGRDDLRVRLVDDGGTVLYANEFETGAPEQVRLVSERVGGAGSSRPFTLTLQLDTSADARLLRRLAWALSSAALGGALVVSAGGFWRVRRSLVPLHGLVEQTRSLTAESIGRRLDGSRQPSELQPLVSQFNALLSRLEAAYEQLESFNADVAHELCTPLATLITGLEVALRQPEAARNQRDLLEGNLEELHRLASIVNDMLFLSRADRGSRARRQDAVGLARLAAEVIDYHDAALAERRLSIEMLGDSVGAWDNGLVKRALSNLVANATRFADPGSTVQVQIEDSPTRNTCLSVTNRGAPIEADATARIFDRFYRADRSRVSADRHHGLGLAIVAAIARMHGGSVFAESKNGLTTVGLELGRGLDPVPAQADTFPAEPGAALTSSTVKPSPGAGLIA